MANKTTQLLLAGPDQGSKDGIQAASASKFLSPRSPASRVKRQISAIFDGLFLVVSSPYLLYVSLFLWLSAVISSFFYFQGRILTIAGVTIAISSAPPVAFLNLVTIAVWPTWVAVAVCETLRKACHCCLACL